MSTCTVRCVLCTKTHTTEAALVPDWLRAHVCRPLPVTLPMSLVDAIAEELQRLSFYEPTTYATQEATR